METQALSPAFTSGSRPRSRRGRVGMRNVHTIIRALGSLLTLIAVFVVCLWAIDTGTTALVSAAAWSVASIWLFEAADQRGLRSAAAIAAGLLLAVTAWLGHFHGPYFTLVAGLGLAASAALPWINGMPENDETN